MKALYDCKTRRMHPTPISCKTAAALLYVGARKDTRKTRAV